MFANRYSGMVPSEIPSMIANRARRYRVDPHDIEDLQQQIVPVLAEFQFDPARSNGATPATAMTAVIDRKILSFLRGKRRQRARVQRVGERFRSTLVAGVDPNWTDHAGLHLDIQAVIDRLAPLDQSVCRAVGAGHKVSGAARLLNISRDRAARALLRVRKAFAAAGLEPALADLNTPEKQR